MMYYNMYINPVYLVLMTTAEIKVPTLFIPKHTHTSIYLHINVNSNPAGNLSNLVDAVHERCNLRQIVRSIQSIRIFWTLLSGFIDSSLNLSSQSVS